MGTPVTMSSEAKSEVIDVDVGKKKKAPKGLVKRLSATKTPKTGEALKESQDKAAAKREAALAAAKEKAKVDIDGAKVKASTDQAKADKAKGDKESAEQKTKQLEN